MILGIGTDIVSIERFTSDKSHMARLANKILTDYELEEYNELKEFHANYLAKKWAAKEAISKAFGTGISGKVQWKSIEVRHTQTGQPKVCFYESLKESVEVLKAKCHLSISDELHTVIAYSIVEY
jgi:holo-[acyl-carrier protein] synthase